MDKSSILFQKPWDYTFFLDQEKGILSVVFVGSRMDYSKSYFLDELQGNVDQQQVEQLVIKIRTNQDDYKVFELD